MAHHLCGSSYVPSCSQLLISSFELWASEWLLSCMGPLMHLQRTWSWKHLTLCALEWILSSVWSHVLSSNLMFRSSCHTLCTWMASLPCGFPHVSSSVLSVTWYDPQEFTRLSYLVDTSGTLVSRWSFPGSSGQSVKRVISEWVNVSVKNCDIFEIVTKLKSSDVLSIYMHCKRLQLLER